MPIAVGQSIYNLKRERVLEVAAGLFREKGYRATPVEDIALQLGIKVEVTTDEYSTFSNKCYGNKFQGICIFGMGLYDPIDYLKSQYYTGGPRNGPGLDDPKVNAKIDDIIATLDEQQRVKKVLDFQRYVSENVLFMLHVLQAPMYPVYQPWLRNFVLALRPSGADWIIYAWIDK